MKRVNTCRTVFLILIGAVFPILIGGASTPHPLHLGVLDLNYRKEGQLEVMVKLFRDDLAGALSKQSGQEIRIDLSNATSDLISQYVRKKVQLTSAGQKLTFDYIGREASDDAEWLYFEAACPRDPRPLQVRNTLLFELFSDQKHFVHFSLEGKQQYSLRLEREQASGTFKL